MKSPFKFLDAFELADKDVFFGRDKEVEALYRMVYQSNLILVYGYSGTGKTSLIQCGLAGRFDGPQWYPFYIRKGEDINQSTRKALGEALDDDLPEDITLAELVEEIRDEYLSPVYLIYDQFEELFILGTPAEQTKFTRDIQDLLSRDLSCKVIFTIREEYLGELYQLEQALPRLFDFKLRVETMNKRKVQEVLRSSFSAFNIGLEVPAEDRLEEIIANVSLKKAGIQLPYLQVYLDQLYREDYARTYPEGETSTAATGTDTPWAPLKFTQAEIGAFGTMAEVFPRFLEGQKEKIQQELAQKYPAAGIDADTLRDVLDAFVTEEGTKRPVPFQLENEQLVIPPKVLAKFPVENPLLTEAVQALEHSRILRVRDGSYELAHDSLAALIDAQRTDEQRQLNEVKVRLAGNYLEWQRTGEYLTRKQLISVEAFLDRLALEPHLEEFVAKSYAHNEAREAAEREKQQAELEKERRLRGAAEDNARQAKRRTRIAAVLALLAMGALIFGYLQFAEAKEKAALLVKNTLEDAQRDILALNYDVALVKYTNAAELNILPEQVGAALMEIAFLQTEAGRYDSAWVLTQQVAGVYGSTVSSAQLTRTDTLAALRETLQGLDADSYQQWGKRYFPEMVDIPGGTFWMGRDTAKDKSDEENELPRHEVELSNFRLARTETTVWQYYLFAEATQWDMPTTPSWQWRGSDPVISVSWYDALAYANWLSRQRGEPIVYELAIPQDPNDLDRRADSIWIDSVNWAASGFRLPTEAEWEYAARGGLEGRDSNYIYSGSDDFEKVAWWGGNSSNRTQPVGQLKANQLGLFDLSGNAWEWCWDWYGSDYYENSPNRDPRGPENGSSRLLRGGSFYFIDLYLRSANRNYILPNDWILNNGFRLAQGY